MFPMKAKVHIPVRILPRDCYTKIPLNDEGYAKLVQNLEANIHLLTIEANRDEFFEHRTHSRFAPENITKALPEIVDRKTFVQLVIPSPNASRTKKGLPITHVNTILIDPDSRKIRINEPMAGCITSKGDVIAFRPEVIEILRKKYPEYSIVNENWRVQQSGENICVYVAARAAQHYANGESGELTRDSIVEGWAQYLEAHAVINQNFSPSMQNFLDLTNNIVNELRGRCRQYLSEALHTTQESSPLTNDIWLTVLKYAFEYIGETYDKNADGMPTAKMETENYQAGIDDFLPLFRFTYNERTFELSEKGRQFVEQLFEIYKPHIDEAIKTGSFENANQYFREHRLTGVPEIKTAVLEAIQSLRSADHSYSGP